MFKNKPIFIGCMPKSGASLLRSLIGNHPNIFGGDGFETNWFADEVKNHWKESDTVRHKDGAPNCRRTLWKGSETPESKRKYTYLEAEIFWEKNWKKEKIWYDRRRQARPP